MKCENQLDFAIIDLRRYLLDNLKDHCEYSVNTAPVISINTAPVISTSNAYTSASIMASSITTIGSTAAKRVLTKAFSASSADSHTCADYKPMLTCTDTSDLETVSCMPLPEGMVIVMILSFHPAPQQCSDHH